MSKDSEIDTDAPGKWSKAIAEELGLHQPVLNKRGVLLELGRVLSLLPEIVGRLSRLHDEVYQFDTELLEWHVDQYMLDHAAEGHIVRLTACLSTLESSDPSECARALRRCELRASVDLRARTVLIVRIARAMLTGKKKIKIHDLAGHGSFSEDERRTNVEERYLEAKDLLAVADEALELMSRLSRAEEQLLTEVGKFRSRWSADRR